MATTTNLSSLKINYLTQEQYDTALAGGNINENEIYMTPSGDIDVNDMTEQEVDEFVDNLNTHGKSSEYRKLLWTNPSPTVAFAAQTISLDLSSYDAIEIVATMYMNNSIAYRETFSGKVGGALVLSATTYGATSDITRLCETSNTQIMFNAGYLGATQNDQAVIPYQIYGIKYERVVSPQLDASDYVIEQGTSGIWTYRKWNSGVAECWGSNTFLLAIDQGWGAMYWATFDQTLPNGLFTSVTSAVAIRGATSGSQNGLVGISLHDVSTTTLGAYVYDVMSMTDTWGFSFHVIGRWK